MPEDEHVTGGDAVGGNTDSADGDADSTSGDAAGSEPTSAPLLRNPGDLEEAELDDWGPVPTTIEGDPRTFGTVLHEGPDGRSESGVWCCTPGYWECHVTSDEFCHFLEGSATYTHESGETIEIEPDTVAFFPDGWTGTCRVHETVRKVYMIR